ncbi:MAG: DUF6514 family protein [Eubacteriales bacterium]|nr:DUF6514 family protein [Eubacteriales bacterium]MDD4476361.1 DUF6514 family protein [Eubacteriales bacterium]
MTISEFVKKVSIDSQPCTLMYRLESADNMHYGYSISISMINNNSGYSYKDTAYNIILEPNVVAELFDKIVLGLVTPVTLRYIVEDFLGSEIILSKAKSVSV